MNTVRYLKALEAQLDLADFYASDFAKQILSRSTMPSTEVYWSKKAQMANGMGDGNMMLASVMGEKTGSAQEAFLYVINDGLQNATPIYVAPWLEDVLSDAMGGYNADDFRLAAHHPPCRIGFCYIDSADGSGWPIERTVGGFNQEIRALLWQVFSDKVNLIAFGPSRSDEPEDGDELNQLIYTDIWRFGQAIDTPPDGFELALNRPDFEDEYDYIGPATADHPDIYYTKRVSFHEGLRSELARQKTTRFYASFIWSFMAQKIVSQREARADRATRHRLERQKRNPETLVTVVELRSRESGKAPSRGEPATHIGVRYIRRMHWHRYWCAGKRSKDCVYGHAHTPELEQRLVEATVCGPAGAPVKSATKLFAVVR